ncbi:unnamed protein product, partial [Prorocentrum cordatum]
MKVKLSIHFGGSCASVDPRMVGWTLHADCCAVDPHLGDDAHAPGPPGADGSGFQSRAELLRVARERDAELRDLRQELSMLQRQGATPRREAEPASQCGSARRLPWELIGAERTTAAGAPADVAAAVCAAKLQRGVHPL